MELGLHVRYQQTLVSEGPPRYCYVTDDGLESPTLRVHPGDRLIIHLHNELPEWHGYPMSQHDTHVVPQDDCAGASMNPSVTNLHFHGMTIPPACHQDEVIRTAIPAGQEFDYRITIPRDEPPGLYWYHPHPHGFSERQVQGGASGALIVEGLDRVVPGIASMGERVLVLRDQQRIGPEASAQTVPTWDLSLNFVPVTYSHGLPATLAMAAGKQEFWRVLNAGADTIFNLQFLIDHVAQAMQLVAIDGVPVTDESAASATQTSILLPPGARAEFIVSAPKLAETAELVTQAWDTGPQGDNDTARTIVNIVSTAGPGQSENASRVPPPKLRGKPAGNRLETGAVTQRHLYFSQRASNPVDPDNFVLYFITVEGQTPAPYRMGSSPNIVIHQGDVEDWTIENRSPEDHVFHIHQIHFRVLEVNGKPVSDPTMRDTIDVPYWKGEGPYPSVKLRMDFRDPNTVGTFLYHCHILKHEDMGMMGSIQVLPREAAKTTSTRRPPPVGTATRQ
ncbi:MAG TPA: multicopper oxidase domain-containing protein [Candidatus Binatia bacterium]|nr:multicopper oxidase domain-containing protein [Candidatus Binatia bacterium]